VEKEKLILWSLKIAFDTSSLAEKHM